MQRDGKTNCPAGKRKTLFWDMKKEAAAGWDHVLSANSTDLGFAAWIAVSFCWIYVLKLKHCKTPALMIVGHAIF